MGLQTKASLCSKIWKTIAEIDILWREKVSIYQNLIKNKNSLQIGINMLIYKEILMNKTNIFVKFLSQLMAIDMLFICISLYTGTVFFVGFLFIYNFFKKI